ncbi:uncharacterized protein LOC110027320 isoform X2 [Phalaenopsis equestris]|nr:uncharacterized protein LOC110027320 isoform X2 [Phalaenopsis equestris]
MKSLPICPKDEDWGCNETSYDPSQDFALFLQEARKHEFQTKLQSSPAKTDEAGKTRKRKNSWKSSLSFLWRKSDKKSSAQKVEHSRMSSSHSGPLFGGRGGAATLLRRSTRRPVSGPLSAWFSQTKEGETESAYMCLGGRNNPSCSHAFGPIYLVT